MLLMFDIYVSAGHTIHVFPQNHIQKTKTHIRESSLDKRPDLNRDLPPSRRAPRTLQLFIFIISYLSYNINYFRSVYYADFISGTQKELEPYGSNSFFAYLCDY